MVDSNSTNSDGAGRGSGDDGDDGDDGFDDDSSLPFPELPGFIDVQSMVERRRGELEHVLKYRSLLGRRMTVKASSTTRSAAYSRVPARDSLSPDGHHWTHNGATKTGRMRWEKAAAGLEVEGHDATVVVEVSVSGQAPYSAMITHRREFPLT